MQFNGSLHLGYSTNIHRGNTWEETFSSLQQATLAVRQQACPADTPYGIGLRLSNTASEELAIETNLDALKRWLDQHNCYVFTINGFPYGNFHETRVKEQVYVPDWQSTKRLDYTKRLFSLLAELSPKGAEGSVSTLPGSFKPWISKPSELQDIQQHLLLCAEHIEALSERYDCDFHLGLEPEPFGYLETTNEMIVFMDSLRSATSQPDLINRRIGVNYDTCHMAIQFETAAESLKRLIEEKIRLSKIHLSSALKVQASASTKAALSQFNDPIYLHQVVSRDTNGQIQRWQDLDLALGAKEEQQHCEQEWRIHFHVPLYAELVAGLDTTVEHLEDTLDFLAQNPSYCTHLEFETYTWEVLPPNMRANSVVDQLVAEHQWCQTALKARGISLQ